MAVLLSKVLLSLLYTLLVHGQPVAHIAYIEQVIENGIFHHVLIVPYPSRYSVGTICTVHGLSN